MNVPPHYTKSRSRSRLGSVSSRDSSEELLNNLVRNQSVRDEISVLNEEIVVDYPGSPLSVLSDVTPGENLASVGVVKNVKKSRARKGKAKKLTWFFEKQKMERMEGSRYLGRSKSLRKTSVQQSER